MNRHPTREEDFDLFALGALESEEKQVIATHVAACEACAEKLAKARGCVTLLALAAREIAPSAGVKEQLLRQIHGEDAGPISALRSESDAGLAPQGFFWNWWNGMLLSLAVAAALAAIFLSSKNAQLQEQMNSLRASLEQQKNELREAREENEMFESSETRMVALTAMPGHPMTARVLYNAKMGMVLCDVQAPAAPAKMAYQFWVVPKEGNPISAGVFNTGSGGWSSWMSDVPKGTEPMMFAITLEPEGGMPRPTGPMVMTAKIL
jgi:anti-sigma-K factor RskA